VRPHPLFHPIVARLPAKEAYVTSRLMDQRTLEIRNLSGENVLFQGKAESLEDLAASAVDQGVYLGYARLPGLKLPGRELKGARLKEALLSASDFSNADLGEAQLCFADLSDCNLSGLVARGADFSGADLTRANLHAADIMGSNLRGAKLTGANLSKANLGAVDLTGADLTDADFTNCNLHGADLSGALVSETDVRAAGGVIIKDAEAAERKERRERIENFFERPETVIFCQLLFTVIQVLSWGLPGWLRLIVWIGITVFSADRWLRNMNALWLYGAMLQYVLYWLDFIPMFIVSKLFY
jgi:uncharacterized protein YjbI with pentapeptide repeats